MAAILSRGEELSIRGQKQCIWPLQISILYNELIKMILLGYNDPKSGNINTLRMRQNGHQFADDIFKFLNENVWTLIKISLKFVPKGSINNIPALLQIMAWHQPGDKPLSASMMA